MATRKAAKKGGAELLWARTLSGKAMPLDAAPSPAGNVFLHDGTDRGGESSPVVTVLGARAALEARGAGRTLYKSHFSTCPSAGQFRRKKR